MAEYLHSHDYWSKIGSNYHDLITGELATPDRLGKRIYIAQAILSLEALAEGKIDWADFGTGEGSKVGDVLTIMNPDSHGLTIDLTAVEPSVDAIPALMERLGQYPGVILKVRNEFFLSHKLKAKTVHCITFLQSTYHLGKKARDFEQIYENAYDALKPGGKLIVQAVNEKSDFMTLGRPPYPLWAQGNHAYKFFCNISKENTLKVDFPTRVDVSEYIFPGEARPETFERLIRFYRFVKQKNQAKPENSELEAFTNDIRVLAKRDKDTGIFYVDFSDVVVSITKPIND